MSGELVPVGYKQTEVGVIPEDWDIAPLETFTSFISYGFTNPMPTSVDGIYMITAKDIEHGKIQFETARCTTLEAYERFLTGKSKPKKNDLLLTKDGTLGRLALVDERKICINQSVAVLRPNGKASPKFLKLLLEAPLYQEKMLEDAGGSTIKHIYITIVNRMPLGVPQGPEEQEAIATTLSDTDALIESLEQLIAKKRQIKQGAMQELLTGKRRLPGFGEGKGYKQSEVGVIPEDWSVQTIGELTTDEILDKPMDGNHGNIHPKSRDFVKSGIPFIMANNIKDGIVDLENCSFIKKEQADSLQKGFSFPGDILLTHKATIGNTAIVGEIQTDYIMLTPQVTYYRVLDSRRLLNYYLRHYFDGDTFQKILEIMAGGGTRSYIGIVGQLQLPIVLPPYPEQEAIATILSDMDSEIATLETKLTKTRQLKQGMMHQLLTGRIRLI